MVCSHCKSKEVIAIKGQNFCLHCGKLVEAPKAAVKTNRANNNRASASDVGPSTEPSRRKHAKGRLKSITRHGGYCQSFGDLSTYDALRLCRQASKVEWKRNLLLSGLTADLVVAASLMLPILVLSTFTITPELIMAERPLLIVTLIWAVFLVGALMVKAWATASFVYGISRQLDHRPVPAKSWTKQAHKHFGDVLAVKLLKATVLVMTAIALLMAFEYIERLPLVGARLPAAFVASLLAAYFTASVIAASAFAKHALILGQRRFASAVAHGWHIANCRSLSVARSALVSLWLVIPYWLVVVMAAYATAFSLNWIEASRWWAALVLAPILIVFGLALHQASHFIQAFWLLVYRKLDGAGSSAKPS